MGPECGFSASGIEEVIFEGEPISSTRIRNALERGEISDANAMLGREYELDGIVVAGREGRAQDRLSHDQSRPRERSFSRRMASTSRASRSALSDRRFDGVTNIGRRPTLYDDTQGDDRDLRARFRANVYGERVRLFFLERLREERKFPSLEALTEQIGRDIEAARAYFAGKPRRRLRPSELLKNGCGRP